MNKQLCSIISNSMKKPQNHEFRWMHLSLCLNTTMRVLLLQNGIPTSHTAFGLSGSYLGMQFILLPFPFFPSPPLQTSPQVWILPRQAGAQHLPKPTIPSSSGMLRLGDAAWLSALRSQAEEGITGARNISCVSRPLCPGHELQLTAEN